MIYCWSWRGNNTAHFFNIDVNSPFVAELLAENYLIELYVWEFIPNDKQLRLWPMSYKRWNIYILVTSYIVISSLRIFYLRVTTAQISRSVTLVLQRYWIQRVMMQGPVAAVERIPAVGLIITLVRMRTLRLSSMRSHAAACST